MFWIKKEASCGAVIMPLAVRRREIIRGSFISSFGGRVLQAVRRQVNAINIVTNDDLIVFIYIKSEKM